MRIGIFTLWNTQTNYGGVLQNFALQKYLSAQGHEPFLVRYKHRSVTLEIKRLIKKILGKKDCVQYNIPEYEQRGFEDFRKKNTSFTEQIFYSARQLNKNFPKADVFIAGSDQVWNYNTFDGSGDPYFLDFGRNRKFARIAYAVSFGSINVRPKFLKYIFPKIKKFDAISCRENEGLDICRLAGVHLDDLKTVCDPTILLTKEKYDSIADNQYDVSGKYIMAYFLGWKTDIPQKEIISFAKENKFQLRYVPSQGMDNNCFGVPSDYPTIPQWISLVRGAQFFVTNSFHGTVFAVIYHVPFIVIPVGGGKERMNSRITTLLKKIGCEDRIYKDGNLEEILKKDVNWNKVDASLQSWRSESELWLKKALKRVAL